MTDLVTLGIAVETGQVKAATVDVATLGKELENTGGQVNSLGQRTAVSNGQMGQFTTTLGGTAKATAQATAAAEQARKAAESLSIAQATLIDRVEQLTRVNGKSIAEQLRQDAAALGLSGQLSKQIDSLVKVKAATEGHTFSMGSSLAKMEVARIAHDGMIGAYTRMGSSAFVLANATGLSAMAFSAMGAAVGITAIIVGGFAYEVFKGAQQVKALNHAIDETNGYAGKTNDQMRGMIGSMDLAHASVGKNTEAFTLLAASGKIGGDQLKDFAQIAVYMAHDTGESIAKVVKELEKISGGAAKFSEEYQKSHHFMDAATMQLVLALDKEGRQAEATAEIIKSLSAEHTRMATRVQNEMGFIGQYMEDWGRGLERIKTKIMNIGMAATNVDQIKDKLENIEGFRKQLDQAETARDDKRAAQQRANIARTTDEINALRNKGAQATDTAAAQAKSAAGGDFVGKAEGYLDSNKYASKAEKYKNEVALENKHYNELMAGAKKASADDETVKKKIEEVTSRHLSNLAKIKEDSEKGPKGPKGKSTYGIAEKSEIDTESRAMSAEKESVRARREMNDFYYKHNLETAEQFYANEKALVLEQEAFDLAAINRKIKATESKKPDNPADKLRQAQELARLKDQLSLEEQVQKNRITTDAMKAAVLPVEKQYNDLVTEATHLKAIESAALAQEAADEKAYKIDVVDGLKERNRITLQYAANLQTVVDKMKTLSKENPFLKKADNKEQDLQGAVDKANDGVKGATQKDPWFAATESMKKYTESAKQDGTEIGKTMDSAFKGAEDAFVQFSTTGKLSFKSLASSIIADLARIQARKAIAGLIDMAVGAFGGSGVTVDTAGVGLTGGSAGDLAGPSLGSLGLGGGRAMGGPVRGGMSYLVGENGPETVTMGGNGNVTPNGGGAGGGSGDVNINITVNAQTGETKTDGKDSQIDYKRIGGMIADKAREVIMQEKRNGGLLAK